MSLSVDALKACVPFHGYEITSLLLVRKYANLNPYLKHLAYLKTFTFSLLSYCAQKESKLLKTF